MTEGVMVAETEPTHAPADGGSDPTPAFWRSSVAPYERPSLRRALLDIATSVLPYLVLTVAMYLASTSPIWLTLALAIPAAGFLLRTFIVFHDCAHGSFLPSKRAQPLARPVARAARLPAVRELAPRPRRPPRDRRRPRPPRQRRRHDADGRRVPTRSPGRGRLGYRLFRNPLVMFGLGPIWSLMIGPRIVAADARPRMRRSVHRDELALAVADRRALSGWSAGATSCSCRCPPRCSPGSAGIWLFYVQHQFEDAYWESAEQLELRRRGAAGQLLPEAAEAAAVLHRQHRPASRPPPERADPQLQPAARARREPDLPRRAPCSPSATACDRSGSS